MERGTRIETAREIMGTNFIGPSELARIADKIGILSPLKIAEGTPPIIFSDYDLVKSKDDYKLILGIPYFHDSSPLTLCKLRSFHGFDPVIKEPCLYNQDWYLKEDFANECRIDKKWYLIRKKVNDETRGPKSLRHQFPDPGSQDFPSALFAVYAFFVNYYCCEKEILWPFDYLWCSDLDHNRDRIYVGRYYDPEGVNKNGFSIHRHLSIRQNYGIVDTY